MGDLMEITARKPREIRVLATRRSQLLSVWRIYTPRTWRTPDGKGASDPAWDGAPMVNSPTRAGQLMPGHCPGERGAAVNRVSASLSPRDRDESANAVPQEGKSCRAFSRRSLRERRPATRGVRSSRKRGAKKKRPRGSLREAAVYCPVDCVRTTDEMAPGPGRYGEVPRAGVPRARECAGAFGGSRRAESNAGLGARFAVYVGIALARRRSERDPRPGGRPAWSTGVERPPGGPQDTSSPASSRTPAPIDRRHQGSHAMRSTMPVVIGRLLAPVWLLRDGGERPTPSSGGRAPPARRPPSEP